MTANSTDRMDNHHAPSTESGQVPSPDNAPLK